MTINRLDHLVLTVANIEETCRFYERVLGMEREVFGNGRIALKFGNQKINLHLKGHEIDPKADKPTPGAADLCFITDTLIDEVIAELIAQNVPLLETKVPRTGANGPIVSVYFRDPDLNLIELSNYVTVDN
ncbi:VOC family protein [Taibaiella soli]|uniref:VOC family protein n=1 Tax=Taibaiella soli TaxID=1649169 RepID=A0A2W2AE24_9BACT|nr:VOC family protein [Taibaiella soli]PZF71802.1 VOC family protein [Taibaiella soli]